MDNRSFQTLLNKKGVLFSDGATGTNLIARGLPGGMTAEQWVLENPDEISRLHADFIESGANIILTCTFGASKIRLEQSSLADHFTEINSKAVEIAENAAKDTKTIVAGSLGPLGEMIQPLGTLSIEDAQKNYAEQARILIDSGVDLVVIETQFDLNEALSAIKGVQSVSDIALICSFSFDRGTKTMMGVSPAKFSETFSGEGLSALGINCGKSLEDNLNCLIELKANTDLPIWFKPNAGLPELDAMGNATYSVTPDEMGSHVQSWKDNGAKIIGGCCGTSPEHLHQITTH